MKAPAQIHRASRLVGLLVLMIVGFVVALTLAYMLPNRLVVASANASLGQFRSEGIYPAPFDTAGLSLDNFSDALMIDIAIADPRHGPLVNAMSNDYQINHAPGYTIEALAQSASGNRTAPVSYAHYWHGYEVFLRPMLLFLSYGDIRYANMLLLGLLFVVTCVSVARSLGPFGVFALTASLLVTGFYVVPLSLEFSPDVYLMLLGMIAVLELEQRGAYERYSWELFLVLGALTAFFDLLTAPILTLGMPVVVLLLSRTLRARLAFLDSWRVLLASSICWGAGYALSWASKWAIGTLVLGRNVLTDALQAAAIRSGDSGNQTLSVVAAFYHNIRYLMPLLRVETSGALHGGRPTAALVTVATLAPIGWLLLRVLRSARARESVRGLAPVLLVGLLPFAWMVVLRQHSNELAWFTYRILAIPVFLVLAVSLYVATAVEAPVD